MKINRIVIGWSIFALVLVILGIVVLIPGFLAGPAVVDAVRAVRPFGVDVSSGVERKRGVKDETLIREFIRAARDAERALSVEESRR